ncbi:DUF2695 domain-containing protein [Glutamicibacter sp. NPDC087344]|uniref:DUF2695 domain-containing protein n=1 Tax=Glutamicibacter sp. NPDC087344 TaxID=3363994 RepID=UPI0038012D7A
MSSLPNPVDHECLACYLYRMGNTLGCSRSTEALTHYRDYSAPRATALERKARLLGGNCDCEVLMNAFRPHTEEVEAAMEEGLDIICKGTRRGSIQPCEQWLMRRGVQWGGGQFRTRSA